MTPSPIVFDRDLDQISPIWTSLDPVFKLAYLLDLNDLLRDAHRAAAIFRAGPPALVGLFNHTRWVLLSPCHRGSPSIALMSRMSGIGSMRLEISRLE